ncbi:MAG: XdhC family protein [Actinomycetota bacterium]
MFEIADRLLAAREAGRRLAVATAVSIEGSAPRTVGTSMAWDGEAVIGSIAGGCVEAAVVSACEEVLGDGVPRTVEYGVDDETAFSVGLTCGGQLRIRVQLFDAGLESSLRSGSPFVVVVCEGDDPEIFVEQPPSRPRMIIFGAMEFSAALAANALLLDYRVTVCDPRPLFATAERFPGVEVVVSWPTTWLAAQQLKTKDIVCILSHDARYDAELVAMALETPAYYVGAMGSRTTHDRRVASLRERGVTDLARLHSPIGLDLGSSTVEETAISILAEIISVRTGATTEPLVATTGTIHRRPA